MRIAKPHPPDDRRSRALVEFPRRIRENSAVAYNTVQVMHSMSGDDVILEIRNLRASVVSKMDIQIAKMDTQIAKMDTQIAKMDAQFESLDAMIDSLRWMIGVAIALLTLLAAAGFLAVIGRAVPVPDPCVHAVSTQAAPNAEASTAAPAAPTSTAAECLSVGGRGRPTACGESHHILGVQPQTDSLK